MVSQIISMSLKIQQNFTLRPPPKYPNTLLYNHLGI